MICLEFHCQWLSVYDRSESCQRMLNIHIHSFCLVHSCLFHFFFPTPWFSLSSSSPLTTHLYNFPILFVLFPFPLAHLFFLFPRLSFLLTVYQHFLSPWHCFLSICEIAFVSKKPINLRENNKTISQQTKRQIKRITDLLLFWHNYSLLVHLTFSTFFSSALSLHFSLSHSRSYLSFYLLLGECFPHNHDEEPREKQSERDIIKKHHISKLSKYALQNCFTLNFSHKATNSHGKRKRAFRIPCSENVVNEKLFHTDIFAEEVIVLC